jgi:hypothetical protein
MQTSQPLNRIWINPFSRAISPEEKIFFLLRLGVLGCFVGHGFWGVVTKEGWVPFFDVFFIGRSSAFSLMPLIGTMDILVGVICFVYPNRALLIWATFWTLFTAMLRPSAAMGMSEFFERAGNYGVPLTFILLYGFPSSKEEWLEKLTPLKSFSPSQIRMMELVLRISLFSLLAGHGGLTVFTQSATLIKHFNFLGLDPSVSNFRLFGSFEILLGLVVLLKPRLQGLMIFILVYKLGSELIFPFAGKPIDIFETIERMGDFVIPVMLLLIYRSQAFRATLATSK